MEIPKPHQTATMCGLGAIFLWAILAALTTTAGPIPPFQLSAMTFAIGAAIGLIWTRLTSGSIRAAFAFDVRALMLGVYGLLFFHACYFFALQRAPAAEASLIIYLWPLLIVLFSALLPKNAGGGPLSWHHVVGALLGLAGTALIVMSGESQNTATANVTGYVMAALAAFIWASYSVASRLLANVPTASVALSCAATSVGAAILHLLVETTTWPTTPTAWWAVIGLGIGPVGLAFYLWDEAMKRADIRLLGVASYATPLFSTLILAAMGISKISAATWVATIFITIGAAIAGFKR